MADTKKTRRKPSEPREATQPAPLVPVSDTVSGSKAAQDPAAALAHYEGLARHLWLPPAVQQLAAGVLSDIRTPKVRWASLSGPYGFGKTAAGITLWKEARDKGFTAIPPLSCSSFDELAQGVAGLAAAQHPEHATRIGRIFSQVWERGLDEAVRADSQRYELPARSVRKLLSDKLEAGTLSLDGQAHRLVEFLAALAEASVQWSKGLVVVLDELQQLLGPLDARAVVQFREFVWGLRTERAPCAVVVCLDAMLEARLARWAADLLHRIRESGPTLQLAEVYTRQFPCWLWDQLTTANGRPALADRRCLTPHVLLSLGQYVERPDLSNGPRTVVDVFSRAILYHSEHNRPYDVAALVADVSEGAFRYFGDGASVQRTLNELLKDDWIQNSPDRVCLVRTLAAFPRGCPSEVAAANLGSTSRLVKARSELFGPLLVELPEGLALERLQQVRRSVADWEHLLARCWETLPANDSLLAHAPALLWRVLGPRLFPESPGADAHWERTSDEDTAALTGWRFLRGSFDEAFPQRDVAVWIGLGEPTTWPDHVDLAVALLCDASPEAAPAACCEAIAGAVPRLSFRLPLLRPLTDYVPPELDRYRKYVQPEPFRPLTVIAALHELEAIAGRQGQPDSTAAGCAKGGAGDSESPVPRLQEFVQTAMSFLLREILQGQVAVGAHRSIRQRGMELVRAFFVAACRIRYPDYRTLIAHHDWTGLVTSYRAALLQDSLSDAQRRGDAPVTGAKSDVLRSLFRQRSTAAGDSFLRLLGDLTRAEGTADTFSLTLARHPAETHALEYLREVGRRRSVPVTAVYESLQHVGYLHVEAEAIVGILIDRGLLTSSRGGVRLLGGEETEREAALVELESLERRLRALGDGGPVPERPDQASPRALWEHVESLRGVLASRLEESKAGLDRQGERLRQLLGVVRAEVIPLQWQASELAAHLRGVAKLLGRTRDGLMQSLQRESGRLGEEQTQANTDAEAWAAGWKKRRANCERVWAGLEDRCTEFRRQAAAVRCWASLCERLASVTELSVKLQRSDPAVAIAVQDLTGAWRERFATDAWAPVEASGEFAAGLDGLEGQTQRLLYGHARAYLGELEQIRVRFGEFLRGPAPLAGAEGQADAPEGLPLFRDLYAWAIRQFEDTAERYRTRRRTGDAWRHPTKPSPSWSDVEGQFTRAVSASKPQPAFEDVVRIGELLVVLKGGFLAAGAAQGRVVLEGPEGAATLNDLEQLLSDGQVRIRVEWIERRNEES